MAWYEDWNPEELLLLMQNFNMNLNVPGTLATWTRIKYLWTLVSGEALRQFDLLSDDAEGTYPINVATIILGLVL